MAATIRVPPSRIKSSLVAIASATTATSTTAAELTAPAARALFFRARDVHCHGAAIDRRAVQGGDRFLRFFFRAHGDKTEAARTAAHAVHDEVGFSNGAVSGESVLQIVFSCVEGKISHKQFRIHSMIIAVRTR